MASNELEVKIGADIDALVKDLDKAKKQLDGFADNVDSFSKRLEKAGAKMKSIGSTMSKYITLPLLALGGASIKMASDLQESFNKVDVAFKDSSVLVKNFAKQTLKSFGIAEGSALEMAALFGDMATGMGVATDEAADLSVSLVGLAGDLASFKNMGIGEITTALNGIFTGETESLKRLGIVMTQANLKAYALAQGVDANVEAMTQAEKIQLRYSYILSVTKNAQGDFTRTQKDSANQMRIFSEGVKQLSASFGEVLLPLFTKIVTKVNSLMDMFQGLDDRTKKIIVVVAAFAAATGPLIFALGVLSASVIPALITGFGILSTAIVTSTTAMYSLTAAMLANPIGLVITLIAGIGLAVVKLVQYLTKAESAWKTFMNALKSFGNASKFVELQIMDQMEASDKAAEATKKAAKESRQAHIDELNSVIATTKAIKEKTKATSESMRPMAVAFSAEGSGISEVTQELPSLVPDTTKLTEDEQRYMAHMAIMKQALMSFNESANQLISGSIADTFGHLGDAIGNALATGGNVLEAAGNAILSSLANLISGLGDELIKLGTAAVLAGTVVKLFGTIAGIGAGIAAIAGGTLLKGVATSLITDKPVELSEREQIIQAEDKKNRRNEIREDLGYDVPKSVVSKIETGSTGQNSYSGSNQSFSGGGSSSGGTVVFEIAGTKLVGVLSNTLSRNKSLNGTLSIN